MFLNGLKVKSILRKLQKVNSENVGFGGVTKLEKIALIQRDDQDLQEKYFNQLIKILNCKKENVFVLNYKESIPEERETESHLFSSKDIGWNATLKSVSLKEYVERDYDLLISFYTDENLALASLTTLTNAAFKVGLKASESMPYDLSIQTSTNEQAIFISELERYLTLLKITK